MQKEFAVLTEKSHMSFSFEPFSMQSSYQKTNFPKGCDSPAPEVSRKGGGNSNTSQIMH